MVQVFISYSRRDLTFVERLAKDLQAAGLDVWYDLSGLEVGTRWGKEIQNAIQNSQYFIFVLSPNSVESEWVEREFILANNLKIKIIPLLHEPCNLPIWVLNLQYIDMQGYNYRLHFDDLLKVLGVQSGMQEQFQPAVALAPSREQPPQKTVRKGSAKTIFALLGAAGIIAILAIFLPKLVDSPPSVDKLPDVTSTSTPTFTRTSIPARSDTPTPTSTITSTSTPTSTPTPIIQFSAVDDAAMVFVPAGSFKMGSASIVLVDQPVHGVTLDNFWIDQTEVTNKMYARCVDAGGCDPLPESGSSDVISIGKYFLADAYKTHPVTSVTWDMAAAYCTWAGRRLPTEAEWEKAARGTDERPYPWGFDTPTCVLANYQPNGEAACVGETTAVGKYPAGISPYGAYDMGGNVYEWVADWYSETYYQSSPPSNPTGPSFGTARVLRGGAFNDSPSATNRYMSAPNEAGNYIGFRCAMDANP